MIKFLFIALVCCCFACNNDCPAAAELAALRDSLSKPAKPSGPDIEKDELQRMFDAALGRLDTLTYFNSELEKKLTERNTEIGRLKEQVNALSGRRGQ